MRHFRDLPARARAALSGSRLRRAALLAAALPVAVLVVLATARSGFVAPEPTLLVRDRAGRFLGELPAPGDERLGFWPVASARSSTSMRAASGVEGAASMYRVLSLKSENFSLLPPNVRATFIMFCTVRGVIWNSVLHQSSNWPCSSMPFTSSSF